MSTLWQYIFGRGSSLATLPQRPFYVESESVRTLSAGGVTAPLRRRSTFLYRVGGGGERE